MQADSEFLWTGILHTMQAKPVTHICHSIDAVYSAPLDWKCSGLEATTEYWSVLVFQHNAMLTYPKEHVCAVLCPGDKGDAAHSADPLELSHGQAYSVSLNEPLRIFMMQ